MSILLDNSVFESNSSTVGKLWFTLLELVLHNYHNSKDINELLLVLADAYEDNSRLDISSGLRFLSSNDKRCFIADFSELGMPAIIEAWYWTSSNAWHHWTAGRETFPQNILDDINKSKHILNYFSSGTVTKFPSFKIAMIEAAIVLSDLNISTI